VETPLHRLFCVEYARMRSGLAVFGDARHWWDHAKNLYARASHPVEEAVMVFAGSKRLKRGHVAVVTEIVSPRQIIVDQANWQNHGEIDHSTPVLDVSTANDWSLVRVWDMHSNTFGTHVYAISGFIAKGLTTASRD
jgi:surface antigen